MINSQFTPTSQESSCQLPTQCSESPTKAGHRHRRHIKVKKNSFINLNSVSCRLSPEKAKAEHHVVCSAE